MNPGQEMTGELPAAEARTNRSARRLLVMGIALLIASVAAYFVLMDIPWIRATAMPVWIALALGIVAALNALVRDRRWLTRGLAALVLVFAPLALLAFFGGAALPKTAAIHVGAIAPDVELTDSNENTLSLREQWSRGPLLLVFYRGFW